MYSDHGGLITYKVDNVPAYELIMKGVHEVTRTAETTNKSKRVTSFYEKNSVVSNQPEHMVYTYATTMDQPYIPGQQVYSELQMGDGYDNGYEQQTQFVYPSGQVVDELQYLHQQPPASEIYQEDNNLGYEYDEMSKLSIYGRD